MPQTTIRQVLEHEYRSARRALRPRRSRKRVAPVMAAQAARIGGGTSTRNRLAWLEIGLFTGAL